MSKNVIPQIYGYAVCLVCVITLIFSVQNLIDNTFAYTQPEQECAYQGSDTPLSGKPEVSTKEVCIQQTEYRALRSIANSGILTAMALVLFIVHWRWVGKLRDEK